MFLFSFFESRVEALPENIANTAAKNFVSNAVNKAIEENSEIIGGLSQVSMTQENTTTMIQSDAEQLSLLKSQISNDINNALNGGYTTYIPIGNLFDNSFLNGRGFKVPVKIYFNGAAQIEFDSLIVSAGVNQSKYRLIMTVSTELYSNSVNYGGSFNFDSQYILNEFVILGEVPFS